MKPKLSEKSDQELVSLTLRDRHAFRGIVERYEAPLKRYIIRLGCIDTHDTEDILQETFLKCYLNLNDYDHDLKFSSWIYRITHNETMTFFRKKKIRPAPALNEDDLRLLENIADEVNLLEHISQKFDVELICKAVGQVDEKYREALVLKFFEEKSYTEISDILEIPEGTVATYISRGKKELKGILSQKRITT